VQRRNEATDRRRIYFNIRYGGREQTGEPRFAIACSPWMVVTLCGLEFASYRYTIKDQERLFIFRVDVRPTKLRFALRLSDGTPTFVTRLPRTRRIVWRFSRPG